MNTLARDMSGRIRSACRIIFNPTHLRRTLLVMAVVGLLLSLFNDGTQIFHGPWHSALIGKIIVNFCMPFVVANLGLLAHHSEY